MLRFENVSFCYAQDDISMMEHLHFEVQDGEFASIIGASGCGKSTIFRLINGLEKLQEGSITVDGKPVQELKHYSAFMPQKDLLFPWRTIEKNICLPLEIAKVPKAEQEQRCQEVLAQVGLTEYRKKYPKDLSGGMKQRTVIAISTILSPKVLIADEPSSALDVTSQKMVIKMMRELMEKGFIKSMIFITHELPLLYNVTDDIMVMYAGQIVEKGTAKEMVFDPVHPYSKGLMGSIIVPEEGTRDIKLEAIPGTPPNLKHPPAGCRFAPRCKYAKPECKLFEIPEKDFDNERMYRCIYDVDYLKEVYGRNG